LRFVLGVFLLGIGFAFNAPVWASIIPEIVQEELASAITLVGVQMNLGGIVGPALGGLLFTDHGPGDALFSVRLNNWWVKMTGLLARCEAGSQVFLRVTNFKSLRQVASYAI